VEKIHVFDHILYLYSSLWLHWRPHLCIRSDVSWIRADNYAVSS